MDISTEHDLPSHSDSVKEIPVFCENTAEFDVEDLDFDVEAAHSADVEKECEILVEKSENSMNVEVTRMDPIQRKKKISSLFDRDITASSGKLVDDQYNRDDEAPLLAHAHVVENGSRPQDIQVTVPVKLQKIDIDCSDISGKVNVNSLPEDNKEKLVQDAIYQALTV